MKKIRNDMRSDPVRISTDLFYILDRIMESWRRIFHVNKTTLQTSAKLWILARISVEILVTI